MSHSKVNRAATAGFSLLELLVAMAIGLILTLAITSVLSVSEGTKRTNTSINDIDQTGNYAAFVLDRAIRSAGSGFSQSWDLVYGCQLDVSQGATHLLPIPTGTIPTTSAFANVTPTTLATRLAPVIIAKGLADTTSPAQVNGDVLMVMSGTGGVGESQQTVQTGSVTTTNALLQNALGYGTGDLVLFSDTGVTAGCMVSQVGSRTRSASGQTLPLGGSYYTATGTNVSLTDFGANSIALQLGNAANLPQFQLFGVGANSTLYSMDLLQPIVPTALPDIPVADGVIEMRALYGLDTTSPPDGVIDSWVDPGSTSPDYTAATLTNGSAASQLKLRQIVAIKLGFILRTSLMEKTPPLGTSALTLTLFGDLGSTLQQTRTIAAGSTDLNYRYRTVELTIPIRNVLLSPQS